MSKIIVILISLAFAIFRLVTDMESLNEHAASGFEAAAHLWVGGLFGAWAVNRKGFFFFTAIALSLVELTAFLMSR